LVLKVSIGGIQAAVKKMKQQIEDAEKAAAFVEKQKLVEALRVVTPIDTGEARAGWHVENDAVVNRVDHISKLNQGSSKQAPTFFVERTVLNNTKLRPKGVIVKNIPSS